MQRLIKIFLALTFLILAIVGLIFGANKKIDYETRDLTADQIELLPGYQTGLLLGTSKYLPGGYPNLYYTYRIIAAVELFRAGKIKNIIVSGDNRAKNYNEPMEMKESLMEKGIPEEHIYLDYAGLRTLDSVVRAKEIFGQTQIIIISQKFHNERAIFIAKQNNLEAFGYNAKDVTSRAGRKTRVREYFARLKVFLDIVSNKQPKFLGEKVIIEG